MSKHDDDDDSDELGGRRDGKSSAPAGPRGSRCPGPSPSWSPPAAPGLQPPRSPSGLVVKCPMDVMSITSITAVNHGNLSRFGGDCLHALSSRVNDATVESTLLFPHVEPSRRREFRHSTAPRPLPRVGVSIRMDRERQQNGSLADGYSSRWTG